MHKLNLRVREASYKVVRSGHKVVSHKDLLENTLKYEIQNIDIIELEGNR